MGQADGEWEVTAGPMLTQAVAGHCSVTLESLIDEVLIIGGASFDSKERKYVMTGRVEGYSSIDGADSVDKTSYPALRTPRSGHACTAFTDKTGKQTVMVAGGQRASKDVLASVESIHLDPFSTTASTEWSEHSSLPRALTGASFITKLGLPILIGGTGYKTNSIKERRLEDLVFSKDILTYDDDDILSGGGWKKVGEVIETVAYHVALALENDICIALKEELTRDIRDSGEEGELWDKENFLDIR